MSTNTSPRAVAPSVWRRRAQLVLAIGAVLAVTTAFGPTWLNYVGIGIAVIAGVVAAVLIWQQVRIERVKRGRDAADFAHNQTEALHTQRTQMDSVLETMRTHNEDAADRLVTARKRLAEVTAELSTARGENAALSAELRSLKTLIAALRRDLLAREEELRAISEDDGELVSMPRRVQISAGEEITTEQIWASGEFPTVVDLQSIGLPIVEDQRRQA